MEECDARILRRRRSNSRGQRFVRRECERWLESTRRRCHECGASPAIFPRALSKNFPDSSVSRKRRDLRAAGRKHSNVRRELDVDHASGRSPAACARSGHERCKRLSIGGEPSVPLPPSGTSMVAAGYGDVPRTSGLIHSASHDDPACIWSGVGRNFYGPARYLFLILGHGAFGSWPAR